jgi:hypothetical protein
MALQGFVIGIAKSVLEDTFKSQKSDGAIRISDGCREVSAPQIVTDCAYFRAWCAGVH